MVITKRIKNEYREFRKKKLAHPQKGV